MRLKGFPGAESAYQGGMFAPVLTVKGNESLHENIWVGIGSSNEVCAYSRPSWGNLATSEKFKKYIPCCTAIATKAPTQHPTKHPTIPAFFFLGEGECRQGPDNKYGLNFAITYGDLSKDIDEDIEETKRRCMSTCWKHRDWCKAAQVSFRWDCNCQLVTSVSLFEKSGETLKTVAWAAKQVIDNLEYTIYCAGGMACDKTKWKGGMLHPRKKYFCYLAEAPTKAPTGKPTAPTSSPTKSPTIKPFWLLGKGECMQSNGRYPLAFAWSYRDLESNDETDVATATSRCQKRCYELKNWCVAVEVSANWKLPECKLITDWERYAKAGNVLNTTAWGG